MTQRTGTVIAVVGAVAALVIVLAGGSLVVAVIVALVAGLAGGLLPYAGRRRSDGMR